MCQIVFSYIEREEKGPYLFGLLDRIQRGKRLLNARRTPVRGVQHKDGGRSYNGFSELALLVKMQ
jgi:hypothetical protein